MADDSYQIELVKDPLSVVARNERRSLLGVGVLALVMSAGIIPTKISALGIEFSNYVQSDLIFIFILVNVYYLVAFFVYGVSDFIAWRVRLIESLVKAYKEKELMSEQQFDIHKRIYSDPITSKYQSLAFGGSIVRALLEFLLPLAFSLFAIYSLYGTYSESKPVPHPKEIMKLQTK